LIEGVVNVVKVYSTQYTENWRPHGDPVACIRCAGPLERLRHGTLVRTMPPNENDPGSVYGVEALCG